MKSSFGVVALLALAIARPARAVPGSPEPSEDERPEPIREAAPEDARLTPENRAQEQPPAEPTDSEAALAEELLTEDAEASDLAWLYSSADEYAPSDVTGTPLPAPGLPGPGGGTPRMWDPRWRKFSTGNYVLLSSAAGLSLASSLIPPVPARWQGTSDLDEWGRRTFSPGPYDNS